MGAAQADEASPGIAIAMRSTFAREVREKQKTLTAGRRLSGLGGQLVIGLRRIPNTLLNQLKERPAERVTPIM